MNTRCEKPGASSSTSETKEDLTIVDYLRMCLKDGRRELAANLLIQIARESNPQHQRDAFLLTALALKEIGDTHSGPGRPKVGYSDEGMLTYMARTYLEEAIMARHVLDGDVIGPTSLTKVMRFAGEGIDENPRVAAAESDGHREQLLRAHPEIVESVRARLQIWASRAQTLQGDPRFDLKLLKGKTRQRWTAVANLQASVPRQGFRAEYRRRFAQHYGVSERLLKDVVPKVDD